MKAFLLVSFFIITASVFAKDWPAAKLLNNDKTITAGSWVDKGEYLEQSKKISPITFAKYSESGLFIYTFSQDSILRTWNASTGELTSEKHLDARSICDVNEQGYVLYTEYYEFEDTYHTTVPLIVKYDLNKNKREFELKPDISPLIHNKQGWPPVYLFGSFGGARFAPNNSKILTWVDLMLENSDVGHTGIIDYWDNNTGKKMSTQGTGYSMGNFPYHFCRSDFYDISTSFAISDNGQMSAYIYEYNFYRQGNYIDEPHFYFNGLIKTADNKDYWLENIFFTHDNKYLLGISFKSDTSTCYAWNTNNRQLAFSHRFFKESRSLYCDLRQNFFTSLMDRYLIFDGIKKLHILELSSGDPVADIDIPVDSVGRRMSRHPSRNEYASGGQDGTLRIFRPKFLNQPFKTSFTADSTTIQRGETVHFRNTSVGEPKRWVWTFGDGSQSLDESPSHVYQDTGTYTVSLYATNDITHDETVKDNYITVLPRPEDIALDPDFSADYKTVIEGDTVHFKDNTKGNPDKWLWRFGDGSSSNLRNPDHVYTKPGSYTVTLIVSNQWKSDTLIMKDLIFVQSRTSVEENGDNDCHFDFTITPNPVNNSAVLSLHISKPQRVQIKLFNQLGQEVAQIAGSYFSSGSNNISFNPRDYALPSGLYYIQLSGETGIAAKVIYLEK